MGDLRERLRASPADWRAVVTGAAAAPGLLLVGLLVGAVEGGVLPGACRGLACLYTTVVVLWAGLLLLAWGVVAALVAVARRRWPDSPWRVRVLAALAAVSWLLPLWPVVVALD